MNLPFDHAVGTVARTDRKSLRQSPSPQAQKIIFSVDVEDWFHILDVQSLPAQSVWHRLPSRMESNFHRLLDIFTENNARVTCFFLGWVAEHFPSLVREAASRGHEIASHGYAHRLVYEMTGNEFYQDALRSKQLLEDISGTAILGYRSAGFSLTNRSPWFFEKLAAAGYLYDSSVFPAARMHGGMAEACRVPFVIGSDSSKIIEFPVSVVSLASKSMCFFGGGYLRLSPYWLIRKMAAEVLHSGRPLIFYIHPREIDPSHPRLEMNLFRRFKSYVNLDGTEDKVRRILDEFPVDTFRNFLERHDRSTFQAFA